MKRVYADYLNDMLENCDKAIRFLGEADFETLIADEEKAYAVVRALEIIGEAARHIPKDLRKQYAEIPWEEATGMRDKVAHDYFGVDYLVVMDTVRKDLPVLREQLRKMLAELKM
jgi:uncharacterized protein with HEPN domain